jgi:S-adenosylmethionine:tRNA ribosyltransferase-isomerase
MKTADFDFALPSERIAVAPANPRDSARLLTVGDALADWSVSDLPKLLHHGDLLVLNDTKVIPAQLIAKHGERMLELTLHRRLRDDAWAAFAKPAKRLRIGDTLEIAETFSCRVADRMAGGDLVLEFDRSGPELMTAIELFGAMPLPPYIRKRRPIGPQDKTDYQTIYAAREGAIAAPTAGLHFTEDLLRQLRDVGVEMVWLTLHVGAGTFLPVKAQDVRDHVMHSEYGEISAAAALAMNNAHEQARRIVAVGTTSLRLMESAVGSDGRIQSFSGETDIFIVPGHRFATADLLLTNFHLPKSTLFMLVAAFAGLERMRRAYSYAIDKKYRFYSYGDASLLERSP